MLQRMGLDIRSPETPKHSPKPNPEPATPTLAIPAPGNLASMSMSFETMLVWRLWPGICEIRTPKQPSCQEALLAKDGLETNLAWAHIFRGQGAMAGELFSRQSRDGWQATEKTQSHSFSFTAVILKYLLFAKI